MHSTPSEGRNARGNNEFADCETETRPLTPGPVGALTHWVLVLGGRGPAHREGVGVDVADLPLGLRLGLTLRLGLGGRRPDLGHVASVCPVLLTMDPRCPIHHGHAVRAHQPLEHSRFFLFYYRKEEAVGLFFLTRGTNYQNKALLDVSFSYYTVLSFVVYGLESRKREGCNMVV